MSQTGHQGTRALGLQCSTKYLPGSNAGAPTRCDAMRCVRGGRAERARGPNASMCSRNGVLCTTLAGAATAAAAAPDSRHSACARQTGCWQVVAGRPQRPPQQDPSCQTQTLPLTPQATSRRLHALVWCAMADGRLVQSLGLTHHLFSRRRQRLLLTALHLLAARCSLLMFMAPSHPSLPPPSHPIARSPIAHRHRSIAPLFPLDPWSTTVHS